MKNLTKMILERMSKRYWMALLLMPQLAVAADGVQITPGMWEMEMTMKMSLMNEPQTKTENVCIEDEEFTPEDFNQEQDSPCDLSSIEVDGNTMKWGISCPGPSGNMTGNWVFTSHGDSVEGSGEMSAEMAGMAMEMDMQWKGNRIGECE